MNKDLHNNVKVSNALNTQAISTNTTTDGVVIDTLGFDSLEFVFKAGVIADGDYTPVIEHSDANTFGGEEEAVPDKFLLGTEAAAKLTASNTLAKIGYRGPKRYVRFTVASANTSDGGTVGAIAIQSHAHILPVE